MGSTHFYQTLFLGLGLLASTSLVYAEEDPNFALVSDQVKNICRQLDTLTVPPGDQPAPSRIKDLGKCEAANFYYGLGSVQQPDYTAARECAFATQNYNVLTMIYANGEGAQKNLNLAIHYACQAGFAPDEIEGRVMHLVELRDHPETAKRFDMCDDVTSGYMMGICASNQEQLAQKHRQQQITELTKNWSASDRQALQHLETAAENFIKTRAANEVDLSGTARAALELQEEGALRDDLVTALKDLDQGKFPLHTADQAAQVDHQLNQIFQQIEKDSHFAMGTIDRQGIKKTQLEWLKYRDAWIAFGKTRYPQVSPDSWKAWLTQKRLEMLQDLIN